jgi:hypothetical protein
VADELIRVFTLDHGPSTNLPYSLNKRGFALRLLLATRVDMHPAPRLLSRSISRFAAGCLLLPAFLCSAPSAIRIKAGAFKPLTDETGVVWEADRGFEGGETIERPNISIANTKTPSLYRAERYSMTGFKQDLPNGKYTVKLHFAETFEGVTAPRERVFSFSVEGKTFKDFDVFVKAGGTDKAYVETVPVEIKDGRLDITFTSNIENPQINAIEILPVN